jgi:hypothetical protein
MTFPPLDFELFGPLFTTDAMRDDICDPLGGCRSVGAFDLAPAVAAAARWVDPALRHAAAICERLVSKDRHPTTIE